MKRCMHIYITLLIRVSTSFYRVQRATVVMTDHRHLLNILPTAVRHFYSQRRSDVPNFARSSLLHATPASPKPTQPNISYIAPKDIDKQYKQKV